MKRVSIQLSVFHFVSACILITGWSFVEEKPFPWVLAGLIAVAALLGGFFFRGNQAPPKESLDVGEKNQGPSLGWEIAEKSRVVSLVKNIFTINLGLVETNLARITQNAHHDASSIEESSNTLVELTQTSDNIASQLTTINENSREAQKAGERANLAIEHTSEQIHEMERSSHAISKIVVTIAGIANQTNLLSLNAAIEAAKAGEQGRGFSVVASEVRNLASRSNIAAAEIKQLIDASSSHIAQSVDSLGQLTTELQPVFTHVEALSNDLDLINRQIQEQHVELTHSTKSAGEIAGSIKQNLGFLNELKQVAAGGVQGLELLESVEGFLDDLAKPRLGQADWPVVGKAFPWAAKYSVKLNTIDDQHKVLIDIIDFLILEQEQGVDRKEVKTLLNAVYKYSVAHFDFEESIMDRLGYGLSDEHKGIHVNFLSTVKLNVDQFQAGKVPLNDIIELLKGWLIEHILKEDPKYYQIFKAGGVE